MGTTRREFLVAAGSVVLLAACGSDSKGGSTPTSAPGAPGTTAGTGATTPAPVGSAPPGFSVAQRFPNSPIFVPGGEARLPVSIVDSTGTLVASGPAQLTGEILSEGGATVATITAPVRGQGISPVYYEVRATIAKAGSYVLRFEGDDGAGAAFGVYEPDKVATPLTGSKMPPFDTPTVDNHRGVEPYCSLTPTPCPLHDVTLTDALKSGKKVCYMIGTPAHCQTGTCAPGLEFLVAEHQRVGDQVVMVHADVYADDAATKVAPAVQALNVDYEPIIYFIDATGTIVDRLDGVWDSGELRERMDLFLKA